MNTNALSSSPNSAMNNLQDTMWRLKVNDDENNNMNNREVGDGDYNPYPDRPEAPDCIYYLRTGVCGYGSNCRYNHPTYNGQVNLDKGELPERAGQPECQYFLKTGTCKFGASCKYHHPRDIHDARPVVLNILGLPLRQDEKSCPYYLRNGACKFGIACKFNHPQPATMGAVYPAAGSPAYGSSVSPMVPSPNVPLIGGLSTWPLGRPPYISSPRMQGISAYMPVMLPPSQGTMPLQQGWSTYTTSNTKLYPQSGSSARTNLPERPNQPDCQYYLKTGSCKYGTSCKYHHPERNSPSSFTLGPFGLPLRPGHAVCTYYGMYGSCRYGPACKYDHPMLGYYNYAMPALSALDPNAMFPTNQMSPLPVAWTTVADTSPTKSSKLPELTKPDEANNSEMNDAPNSNEQDGNPNSTSSESPKKSQ